jgi:ADP-ribosyl-[dinitrogen reductase] hydrolase
MFPARYAYGCETPAENNRMAKIKTSTDYPLQIGSVSVPNCAGRIGMTLCPGKHQRDGATGHWQRDIALDLGVIEAWGASVIVNLIEDHEMQALAVEHTAGQVPAGIEYRRLPIPDYGVPSGAWELQWEALAPDLRQRLQAGERLLVHCKGGLGRAGTVTARLLIEMGSNADDAIKAVRQARPGAIETQAQKDYVRNIKSQLLN